MIRTDGRTHRCMDGQTDGISPHSTRIHPLSGPLPKNKSNAQSWRIFSSTPPQTRFFPCFHHPATIKINSCHSKLWLCLILHFIAGIMNSEELSSVSSVSNIGFFTNFSLKDKLSANFEIFALPIVKALWKHCDFHVHDAHQK